MYYRVPRLALVGFLVAIGCKTATAQGSCLAPPSIDLACTLQCAAFWACLVNPACTNCDDLFARTLERCNCYEFASGTRDAPICGPGIASSCGNVCCAASCGTCGGCGCASRSGGADECCPGTIVHNSLNCLIVTDTGCIIDSDLVCPPEGGTSCRTPAPVPASS